MKGRRKVTKDFGTPPALSPLAVTLLQSSFECVKVVDGEGRIQLVNQNGLAALEIDQPDAVVGQPWSSLWPSESRSKVEESLREARTGGVGHFTALRPTADGAPKWWDVSVSAVRIEDGQAQFVIVSRDITRQQLGQMAENLHHQRLRTAIAASGDVLWDIDLVDDRVWWSEGMQTIFGYGRDEIGDRTQWCHEHIHPDDRARVVKGMTDAVANGDVYWEDEFRYRAADGRYLVVLDRGSIFRDPSGRALNFIGVMQDITARAAASERRDGLARELAHRINNTLAVVSGLFQQTAATSADVDQLRATFGKRLMAMASANAVLVRSSSGGAKLEALAQVQLGAFAGEGRVEIASSTPVTVTFETAQPLALVLNELATNAIKYGALARPSGKVVVGWTIEPAGDLVLSWRERGGPPVGAPSRAGLGSRLIDHAIPGAVVERRFDPEGFNCRVRIPAISLIASAASRGTGKA